MNWASPTQMAMARHAAFVEANRQVDNLQRIEVYGNVPRNSPHKPVRAILRPQTDVRPLGPT
jgi:hypothetical protein